MSKVLQMKSTLNFGPRDLKNNTVGNGYVLSSKEWVAIQTYVQNGMALPTTDEEFRVYANLKSTDTIQDISDIYDAYKKVHAHCNTWQHSTFPDSVSLASDIVSYNVYVKVYYPKLKDKINKYTDNPTDKVKNELQKIINTLKNYAERSHTKAAKIYDDINQFAIDTESDKTKIEKLYNNYKEKYDGKNGEIKKFGKDIEELNKKLSTLNEEYNHDVVVAATTPTYAWATIFGFIAAVIVAGKFGAAAVECKKEMDEVQKQINEKDSELKRDIYIKTMLSHALNSLDNTKKNIEKALTALKKVKGSWQSLRDDLEALTKIFENDIKNQDAETWASAFEVAQDEWNQVAQNADNYRHNAYVNFQGFPTVS